MGTRSLQICAGIIFTLILSKIILKDKISILKILVAVFIVSGVVLTLSAQSFVHSNCMQPRTISGFKNMSLSPTTSVKNNDREVRIRLQVKYFILLIVLISVAPNDPNNLKKYSTWHEIPIHLFCIGLQFSASFRPPTKLQEGNVFSRVRLFTREGSNETNTHNGLKQGPPTCSNVFNLDLTLQGPPPDTFRLVHRRIFCTGTSLPGCG